MEHQLQFDKNRRRAEFCPCGKSNKDSKFSPFKGYNDKGYCHSCGKSFLPDLKNKSYDFLSEIKPIFKPKDEFITSFISLNIFYKSLIAYEINNFVGYLKSIFKSDIVDEAVSKYKIGTSRHWLGSTVFWQIDELGNVRTGKIMLYAQSTGKRVKKPFDHISWVHSVLKLPAYKLNQVLFGTHLLKSSDSTVAIVESEKTAVIASICFPDVTWLEAGSKDGLKIEKFYPLKNRSIVLYPDANAYELWANFANKNNKEFRIKVSNLLNISLSDEAKEEGEDIADYLLKSIPDHLRVNHYHQSSAEIMSIPDTVGNDKIEEYTKANPNLGSIISKLNLLADPNPTTNDKWQNDTPATIKAIKLEIKPETAYHIDEIKSLIKKHHSALNINFENIIQQLIDNSVIVQNVLNHEYCYKYDSTPF